MSSTNEAIGVLRLHVAVNCFKSELLGSLHIPGKPQTLSVLDELPSPPTPDDNQIFCENTWENWFSDTPIVMKPSKAKGLDKVAVEKFGFVNQDGDKCSDLPLQYFEELVHGGLVSKMLAKTRSSRVRQVLEARAKEYSPISMLHLHLDAIEINTMTDDFHDVPWTEVMAIAAQRILNLLSEQWGPRSGWVYSNFSSPLKIQWEAADESERTKIRDNYARLKPDMFEEKIQEGAYPNWELMGVDNDVAPQHIYKTLFAMAADTDFLVEDRLSGWVPSLAISALSMRALAWSDRYNTFGMKITDEMHFLNAFDHLLFDDEVGDVDEWYVHPAMKCCRAEWQEDSLAIFSKARSLYQMELHKNGVSPLEVSRIVKSAESEHPLVYHG